MGTHSPNFFFTWKIHPPEFKNFNFHAKFIVNPTHTRENNLSFFHFSFLNITHSIFPKLEQSRRDGKITSESDLNYQWSFLLLAPLQIWNDDFQKTPTGKCTNQTKLTRRGELSESKGKKETDREENFKKTVVIFPGKVSQRTRNEIIPCLIWGK